MVSAAPGQLTPTMVTVSPKEFLIQRPSVVRGPYGHASSRTGREWQSDSNGARKAKELIASMMMEDELEIREFVELCPAGGDAVLIH